MLDQNGHTQSIRLSTVPAEPDKELTDLGTGKGSESLFGKAGSEMMNPIQTLEPRYLYAPIPKMSIQQMADEGYRRCQICGDFKQDVQLTEIERFKKLNACEPCRNQIARANRKREQAVCKHENRERFHGNHYSQRIEICNDCGKEFTVEIEDAEAIWELNA